MKVLQISLLDSPEIYMDGHQITFPLKKADALFFYMAVEKHATRTQLSGLLWGGQPEETARKSLRNVLYYIKKSLGFDPFISPKKQILNLSPDVVFEVDVDQFLREKDLSVYKTEFLHGFSLKDSYEYDEWMNNLRSRYMDIYLQELYCRFRATPETEVQVREDLFHRYINKDPLNEQIYHLMMETYYHQRLFLKGIKCYEHLVNVLKQDLDLSPSTDVQQLYRVLIQEWKQNALPAQDSPAEDFRPMILGRAREMGILQKAYQQLIVHKGSCLFLTGESGVGKSFLCHHFLDQLNGDSVMILRTSCFDQEQTMPLYVWNNILVQLEQQCRNHNIPLSPQLFQSIQSIFPMLESFSTLDDLPQDVTGTYNYRAVRNSVLRLFAQVSAHIPMVLFLDDSHNMDDMSAEWLASLIRQDNKNLLILCTCPLHLSPYSSHMLNTMVCYRNVQKIILERFTLEDARKLITKRQLTLEEDEIQQIYRQSQGNAFFLNLMLDHFGESTADEPSAPRTKDMLAGKLVRLSRDARQLLDLISLFHDYATLELLQSITGQDPIHILDSLDQLILQDLITEEAGNTSRFRFLYPQMREFVLSQLSPSRARVYHLRIAQYLEQLPGPHNTRWYTQLIEHYTLAGMTAKALAFRIRRMEAYANRSYELYPVLSANIDDMASSMDEIFQQLNAMKEELMDCYQLYPDQIDYQEAEGRLYLTLGKTCIQQGLYEEGLNSIHHILEHNAYVKENAGVRRSCYRQLIFYGIQKCNLEVMRQALEQCERIDRDLADSSEMAIDLRLKGRYYMLKGEWEESNRLLNEAIETFRSSPLQLQTYTVNLAACYNYLGELELIRQRYPEAIRYLQTAIKLCKDKGGMENPTFYANLAEAYICTSNWSGAENASSHASILYEGSSTRMGRALCHCCCGYLAYRKGDTAKAEYYYHRALRSAEKLQNPRDLAICEKLKQSMQGL